MKYRKIKIESNMNSKFSHENGQLVEITGNREIVLPYKIYNKCILYELPETSPTEPIPFGFDFSEQSMIEGKPKNPNATRWFIARVMGVVIRPHLLEVELEYEI